MFKQAILAGASALALTSSVLAADLPRRAAPPPVLLPVFTWTGFYIGANAGYITTDQRSAILTAPASAVLEGNIVTGGRSRFVNTNTDGFTAGGQIGYNYQFGNVVVGLEADAAYTDVSSRRAFNTLSGANGVRQDLNYLGTVRGRLGYAFDRLLVYGTGGLAYGEVNTGASFYNNALGGALAYNGFRRDTDLGWVAGAGVEYALPASFSLFGSTAVTIKAEALYYDLGRHSVAINAVTPIVTQPGYNKSFETSGIIGRAGLNFKFNWF